jgi:uncharacterized protein
LELYGANAKKTQEPDLQFEIAVFMVDASKTLPIPELTPANVMDVEKAIDRREDLIKEATSLLKRNADRGHMPSQYFSSSLPSTATRTPPTILFVVLFVVGEK